MEAGPKKLTVGAEAYEDDHTEKGQKETRVWLNLLFLGAWNKPTPQKEGLSWSQKDNHAENKQQESGVRFDLLLLTGWKKQAPVFKGWV